MPDKWEELLPFYAAGTLDPTQRTALERHLDGCETCRRSLNEWNLIGDAVRSEAESWSRTLPLPRYNGQFSTAPPTARVNAVRNRRQRSWTIMTLAASFVAVLMIGSLIIYMATRENPDIPAAHPDDGTGVASNSTAVAATQTALATAMAQPTSTDLGLLVNTVAPTETFTIIFDPTTTPVPTTVGGMGGGGGNGGGGGSDNTFTMQGTNVPPSGVYPTPAGCGVRTEIASGVKIYRAPGPYSEVIDTLYVGDYQEVYVMSGDGWYELIAPNVQLLGWVWSGDVIVEGPGCVSLPMPSPTMAQTFGPCMGLALQTLTLRPDPSEGSPITARISSGATVGVLSLSDNGWYWVQAIDSSMGWTPSNTVSLSGDCNDLQYVTGYLGFGTPTPTPTFTP